MNNVRPVIATTPAGRFKAYVVGQPRFHLSDWTGCNFRIVAIPDQKHRGYTTEEEAVNAFKLAFPSEEALDRWAKRVGDGTFLTDERARREVVSIRWQAGEWILWGRLKSESPIRDAAVRAKLFVGHD